MDVDQVVARTRDALARGDWALALRLLDEFVDAAPSTALDPTLLELRAHAQYGAGELEASITAWEDLHRLLVERDDPTGAARAAAMVAMYLMMDTGLMAPVRGWVRRAERLLEGHDDAPARALVAMVRTYERFMCGDMAAARRHATAAIELGEQLGVPPAVVIGRVASARLTILDGRVDEGVELLDEIAVLLMSGEVDPLTTGMMYCELICAAQGLALHERAAEWTDLMERWRHGVAFGGINGRCRVHRAEILRLTGPCDAAEAEALGACEELRPWMRREFGWPLVELGNVRLRKGDLAGAEEAFLAAHARAWSPMPGLALLRLAQGDVQGASELIADAVVHPFDVPSKERPPFGDLRLAPLLDAQVEIAVAAGDADVARTAAGRLASIADSYPSTALRASASLAVARAAFVSGEHDAAIGAARRAVAAWADVGAPFDAAIARVVLGDAHRCVGNDEAARLEWDAARSALEAFGASGWVEQVEHRLDRGASPAPCADPAVAASFRVDGDVRHVGLAGRTVMLRDLIGFRYLERLLADPGRELHVLDLVAVEQGMPPTRVAPVDEHDDGFGPAGQGLPVLDETARAAYRRRLAEVDDDIEEATRTNDLGRLELAQRDREYLIAELAGAVGLGGRARTTGGTAERARTSVARSIRYAIGRLAEHNPPLAAHLEQCVRTGTYCRYEPDPLAPVAWEL